MAGKTSRRHVAAGAAVTIAATGLVALLSAATNAAVVGSLTISPATGADNTPMSVTTSAGCPSGGTNVTVRVFGNGFPQAGQVVVGNTDAGVSQSQSFTVALSDTLRAFAAQQNPPATLNGTYTLDLNCQDVFGSQGFGNFTGTLTFSSPSSYTTSSSPPPTTAPPTTAPPTTAPPTTAPPTTAPPTTAPPTTAPPTTAPPTTAPPTTRPPTTAPPVDNQGYALRISPEYIRVKPGTAIVLATRLVRTDGRHVPGKAVGFFTRARGGSVFGLSRRTTTDDDGLSFGFFTVRDDFRFYTNFNLSPTAAGARSGPGLVQIVRDIA